jgi:ATP-dependent RNA helicase RhlE
VLAPTRELAVQIEDQVQGLTYHTTVSSVAVYGGVPMDIQERALTAHVDIVVATPGRLMDHMRHDHRLLRPRECWCSTRPTACSTWASGPTSSGSCGPARRAQTLLFSATMPAEVLKLTQEFLHDPKYVQVGRRGGPAQTISHAVQEVPAAEKTQWLAQWLRTSARPGAGVLPHQDWRRPLATRLSGMGIRAAALHADRTQQQRMAAVEGFRPAPTRCSSATDVAARGLDIEGIAHVVNFEVPDTPRPTCIASAGRPR